MHAYPFSVNYLVKQPFGQQMQIGGHQQSRRLNFDRQFSIEICCLKQKIVIHYTSIYYFIMNIAIQIYYRRW